MRRYVWVIAGALASAASAQEAADKSLKLTIYNSNLALVEHVRPLNLAAGRHRIEFAGVSAEIMSQTVSFAGAGLTVIEQNFDYDLLTPQKLMEKAVGSRVRIVRTNPGTGAETEETAEVLERILGQEKNLMPNLDWPAGRLYHALGLEVPLYTPIFVMARVTGWSAHVIEQSENNRLIRPRGRYIGPDVRAVKPIAERG